MGITYSNKFFDKFDVELTTDHTLAGGTLKTEFELVCTSLATTFDFKRIWKLASLSIASL